MRSLLRRSGGNPLYLRAVTDLARSGDADQLDADAGSQLRSLVRAALSGLPSHATELLDAAAVLGEEVDVGVLAEVCQRPPAGIAEDVDAAVRAGVLAEVPTGGAGRHRFVHAVVREGVYADLDPSGGRRCTAGGTGPAGTGRARPGPRRPGRRALVALRPRAGGPAYGRRLGGPGRRRGDPLVGGRRGGALPGDGAG